MDDILSQVLTYLLLAVMVAAFRALGLFLGRLAERQGEGLKRDYLDLLATLVADTVTALDQRVVKPTKESGTWDVELARQVKREAVETVLGKLQEGQRKLLGRAVGDLKSVVDDMVERQVRERREGGQVLAKLSTR